MDVINHFIGASLIVASALLTLWRKKKAFDIQCYSTYWQQLSAKTIEGISSFLSLLLLIAGVWVMAIEYQNSWGAFVLLPVYGFMIFVLIGVA
jgi:hypothetical protein